MIDPDDIRERAIGSMYEPEFRELADEIELLRNLVFDIKAWDVGQCMTIPHKLRARIETALKPNRY